MIGFLTVNLRNEDYLFLFISTIMTNITLGVVAYHGHTCLAMGALLGGNNQVDHPFPSSPRHYQFSSSFQEDCSGEHEQ